MDNSKLKKSLMFYQSPGGHKRLNKALRGTSPVESELKDHVNNLSQGIESRGSILSNKVYRAIDADILGGRDLLTKGRELGDQAFLSTTKSRRTAHSFIQDEGSFDGGDPVVFEIDPGQHKGLDVDSILSKNDSRYHGEQEVLFDKGKKLHITGQGQPIYI